MTTWYMLTLVGEDHPGIVAQVSQALYQGNCLLGEASMMRLGGNFTIMLMVSSQKNDTHIQQLLQSIAEKFALQFHIDPIEGKLHQHHLPDVQIMVHGADRAGIVAQVTQAAANAGLDILDLESDVAGTEQQPIYIMQIAGMAKQGTDKIQAALSSFEQQGIDVKVTVIDTMIG